MIVWKRGKTVSPSNAPHSAAVARTWRDALLRRLDAAGCHWVPLGCRWAGEGVGSTAAYQGWPARFVSHPIAHVFSTPRSRLSTKRELLPGGRYSAFSAPSPPSIAMSCPRLRAGCRSVRHDLQMAESALQKIGVARLIAAERGQGLAPLGRHLKQMTLLRPA